MPEILRKHSQAARIGLLGTGMICAALLALSLWVSYLIMPFIPAWLDPFKTIPMFVILVVPMIFLLTDDRPAPRPIAETLAKLEDASLSKADQSRARRQLEADLGRAEAEEILQNEEALAYLVKASTETDLTWQLLMTSARVEAPLLRKACLGRFASYRLDDSRLEHDQAQALVIIRSGFPPGAQQ